jgi:hypothetical protein
VFEGEICCCPLFQAGISMTWKLEGFVVLEKEDYVYRLKKSLYGLKQSLRQLYKRFDSFMISNGFQMS